MQNLRQGTADGWRKHDRDAQSHVARWGVSTRSCSGGQAAAATACRAAITPPSTYRTNAANGMRRYTRIPLRVLMQLWWNLISGFWPDYHIRYPDLGKIRY